MASIFTYETDPIQVASPWPKESPHPSNGTARIDESALEFPRAIPLSEYGITKLVPEPQEGPVEYKLHLLLRPRRTFSATSTMQKVSGSHLSKARLPSSYSSEPSSRSSTPTLAPSNVSRQKRLRHLTTQLLWRLQQSCPHHASSKSELVVPILPEAELRLSASKGPGEVAAGLEESLGALYEIGVSDDGSFIGLARDELDESLTVLRAMAYSLGCELQVLRLVDVGECQWNEDVRTDSESSARICKDRLHVAEVLVGPGVALPSQLGGATAVRTGSPHPGSVNGRSLGGNKSDMQQCQLRVSLTGSTTCGKSSLLGTLSTSTLDNGRGSSRLSLLKHRHEIVSGVTSSLAQELIGYHQHPYDDGVTDVVNYASDNVSSWNDIHSAAQPGRLVFVTDSAGHPRYRRTTVRGLISWAPHWTLCCIAADDGEEIVGSRGSTASAAEILGSLGEGVDLSKAHLALCLRLELPMVVVITKYDLASRDRLRQTMAKILSTLKDAGRRPVLLPITPLKGYSSPSQSISKEDIDAVTKVLSSTSPESLHSLVPIVCTSALNGTGVAKVHELLRQLPILPSMTPAIEMRIGSHDPLFHIDEVTTTAHRGEVNASSGTTAPSDYILSGYLRHGSLGVGEHVLIGPCAGQSPLEVPENAADHFSGSPRLGSKASSLQNPSSLSKSYPAISRHRSGVHLSPRPSQGITDVWNTVSITSIRYLRLPVRRLHTGQVATIAISTAAPETSSLLSTASPSRPVPRKGMVLLRAPSSSTANPMTSPPAYSTFTAVFKEPNTYVIPGSSVTVYIASIRALAKIIEVRVPEMGIGIKGGHDQSRSSNGNDIFTFDDDDGDEQQGGEGEAADTEEESRLEAIEITFSFASSREWIEIGTRVLVTPASGLSMLNPPPPVAAPISSSSASGPSSSSSIERGAGLDGFVGIIVGAA